MTGEERLRELFERAAELGPEQRARFLEEECDSQELRQEVLDLLRADESASNSETWRRSGFENERLAHKASGDPAIDEVIGPYRIVSLLGSGGMGKVYRAVRADQQYKKVVAIKRIRTGMDAGQIVDRFRAERQILADLEHPNIARMLDGGVDSGGLPYLAMEFVEGVVPAEYANRNNLSLVERLGMFRQICAGVHYAHQRMVVHRDLKPANILVTANGTPKLLDFGIAKVLATGPAAHDSTADTGIHLMTARYASPEQIRGESVTTASDIYSLGVILYELLTDASPYRDEGRPVHQLMRAVCEEEPIKPSVHKPALRGDLDKIILKALRKDPAERYASADQFSEDIGRYLTGLPVLARGDSFAYLASKFIRRYRIGVAAAALMLCLLVGSLIAVTRSRARAEHRFNQVRELARAVVFDYHDAIENLPGSTPVRARLVKDALHYLDSLSSEAEDGALQHELLDAYVRISRVQGDTYANNLGDTAGAAASAKKAIALAESLLKRDRSPGTLASAADAYSVLASLSFSSGDLAQADRLFHRALDLRETIAKTDPDSAGNAIELSNTLNHLGDLYGGGGGMQNLGRSEESFSFYQQADKLAAEWQARLPSDIRFARRRFGAQTSLAAASSSLGRVADAERYLREAFRLAEGISAADPNHSMDRLEVANIALRLGKLYIVDLHPDQAIPYLERSLGIVEGLVAADPRNALYRRDLSVTESQYAAALRASGSFQAALQHNQNSLRLAEALAKADPDSIEYRCDMAISHRKLSETMLAAGDPAGALAHASQAEAILCDGIPSAAQDSYTQSHCGYARFAAGNARLKTGDWPGAVESFFQAKDVADRLSKTDPANMTYRADRAQAGAALASALEHLNRLPEAREAYQQAVADWAGLGSRKSPRAEEAARGLASVEARLSGGRRLRAAGR